MKPTIRDGQILVVQDYGSAAPQRGDIIVFQAPPEALVKCPPSGDAGQTNPDFVKRIIGLPSDTVQIEANGEVFVDSTLLNEPYINPGPSFHDLGAWHLDSGQYFVMGDNRGDSCDSCDFGPIDRSSIASKVVSII
jgi:signal peptidase I